MPTPHNKALKEEIADVVIMSGDPKRAEYIALKYLDDYRLVNDVRGMFAFTGYYKGKRVTIMGHGMGIPSAGIYMYELFHFYDVQKIIRIGSCGSLHESVRTLDVVLADKAYSISNYAYQFSGDTRNVMEATKPLTNHIYEVSKNLGIDIKRGPIYTSDVFDVYVDIDHITNQFDDELLATEMECFVLFYLAEFCNKEAAAMLTVVDSKFDKGNLTPEQREKSLNNMIEIALESLL